LRQRVEVPGQFKTLEQQRQAIDAELLVVVSDPELHQGGRAPGRRVLRARSRIPWDDAPKIRAAIKDAQRIAQRGGRAQPLVSSDLCLTHGSTWAPNRGSNRHRSVAGAPASRFLRETWENHVGCNKL